MGKEMYKQLSSIQDQYKAGVKMMQNKLSSLRVSMQVKSATMTSAAQDVLDLIRILDKDAQYGPGLYVMRSLTSSMEARYHLS
jgi:hypothetical protein